jgi:asparagine synthase (glutamine-hydrolysing)
MCGIGGHFGRPVAAPVRVRMLDALRARGPDAQHIVAFDARGRIADASLPADVALVHARLSIIDPRPVSDQPMASDDGTLWLCYNGEVYGWQDEARALEARGMRFRTRSDTEFILRAYEAYGIDGMLARLRGMFAFALLDFRTRRVHLVRDRLGLKPLVYAHVGGALAFGSTVRSVLPWLPDARRRLSPDAIDAYLAHRYVPAPRTIFADIARLPNAHRLEYALDSGDVAQFRYWVPESAPNADCAALLDESIALRLVADRPLGLFLSGGVDSTTIASRLAATGHSGLRAFCAAFPGSSYDESPYANATADALGFPIADVAIPTTIRDDFATIVAALDEPFADPSAFPTWYLARVASAEVKVVLGGDGGDELFGGYKRVAKHLRNRWRGALRLPLPTLADPKPKGWRKVASELSVDWESAYALRFSGLTPNQRRFLQPGMRHLPAHYWREPDVNAASPAERLLRWDFANFLPEYALRKSDLCTMAHGLELRAPLLDHRFVDAIVALPRQLRFTRPPKRLLASLAPGLDQLGVFARKKRGFNPPLSDWLSFDLADRVATAGDSLASRTSGQLDAARTSALLAAYARTPALAEQVLSLLMLDECLAQLAREVARAA